MAKLRGEEGYTPITNKYNPTPTQTPTGIDWSAIMRGLTGQGQILGTNAPVKAAPQYKNPFSGMPLQGGGAVQESIVPGQFGNPFGPIDLSGAIGGKSNNQGSVIPNYLNYQFNAGQQPNNPAAEPQTYLQNPFYGLPGQAGNVGNPKSIPYGQSDFAKWWLQYYGKPFSLTDALLQNQPLGMVAPAKTQPKTSTYKGGGGYGGGGGGGGYSGLPKWFLDMVYWRI